MELVEVCAGEGLSGVGAAAVTLGVIQVPQPGSRAEPWRQCGWRCAHGRFLSVGACSPAEQAFKKNFHAEEVSRQPETAC